MSTEGGPKASSGSSGSGAVVTSAKAAAAAAAAAAPWKGRMIKRFKLVEEIGAGAMGRVFVAEDTVIRRHVALKLLPGKRKDGSIDRRSERLVREARSAASLEHPNVVTIHEIDEFSGVHYIAMEHVEGGNLDKLVQLSGPMEIERACQLCAEAAEALYHAHQRGIIHRDIKPANLLLTRSGRCKVADFGLAVFDDVTDASQRARVAGTPQFIAPEVALGQDCTEASDIYSLGCTLWYLLSGRAPFTASSAREVMKLHVNSPLPDLRRWRPDIPPRLLEAVEKACAKNPIDRFSDADRFAKILRTFTISTGSSASAANMAPLGAGASVGSASMSMSVAGVAPLPGPQAAPPSHAAIPLPMIWAGVGTLATAVLIALGVWLAHSDKSAAPAAPAFAAAPAPQTPKSSPPAAVKTPVTPIVVAQKSAPPSKSSSAAAPATTLPAATAASVVTAPGSIVGAPAPPARQNIVKNGAFDALDSDGKLLNWTIPPRFASGVAVMNENGNAYLHLSNNDTPRNVMIEQEIGLEPAWKALIVVVKIRGANLQGGNQQGHDFRLAMTFHDAQGKRIGGWPIVPKLDKDSPWSVRKATLPIPEGAKSVLVQPAIFQAAGNADFDDISITAQ